MKTAQFSTRRIATLLLSLHLSAALFLLAPLYAAESPAPLAAVSSASFEPTVAPDSLASLFGTNLAPETLVGALDGEGLLPVSLGGVSVVIDGRLAPLLFVSPTQINFLVPAGTPAGRVGLAVIQAADENPEEPQLFVQVAPVAPALFQVGTLHPDRGAALDAITFQPAPIRSVAAGGAGSATYVSLFGTGFRNAAEVVVQFVDRTGHVTEAEILYTGLAPGFLGLDQLNLVVPASLEGAGVIELRLFADGRFSNAVSVDLTNISTPPFAPEQYFIRAFAGNGAPGHDGDGLGSTLAMLNGPRDVEIGRDGSVFIADALNHVVRRVSPAGVITTFAGTGEEGSEGDGGLAVEASLQSPVSVAADAQGNLYIVDAADHRVRRIDPHGVITAFAGNGVEGFGGDGGAAESAQLAAPAGVAVNAHGSVLIADTGNNRIRLVTMDGLIQTIAGSGEPGDAGDGGPAVSAELDAPTSIAISRLNAIFIADSGNRKIRRVDPNGMIRTVLNMQHEDEVDDGTANGLFVALDPNEELLLSDEQLHHFSVFALDDQMHLVAGQDWPGPQGDGGPALEAELHSPSGLASNPFGDVLLADSLNHRVRMLWRKLGDENATCGQVAAMTFEPTVVIGGEQAVGFIRFNCPAGEDVTVLLSSDVPGVPAPPSVTIPAGVVFAVFIIDTPPVEEPVTVTVTGSGGGGSSGGSFTIVPGDGPGINGLTVVAESVIGGQSTVGRLTLGAPAPAGGLLVELTSSHLEASVVSTVLVPEGAIGAEFQINTSPVDKPLLVVINGSTGELSASGTLLILPGGDGDGPQLISLVIDASAVLGGASATATVTVNEPAPGGGLEVFLSSSTPMLTAPAAVVIPAGEVSVSFPVQTLAVQARLVATLRASCTNTVQATLTINAESSPGDREILALTLTPSTVTGGQGSTGTVELAAAAPAGGVLVNLASNNANAATPASIIIPAGQATGQFVIDTLPVGVQESASITATSANVVSASLTINPAQPVQGQLAGLSLSPSTVNGGQSSTGTVTLAGSAPLGGVLVNLSSGNPTASTPSSLVIPEGQTSGQFTVTTSVAASNQSAVITASSANSVNATLTINQTPAGQAQIAGLTLSPNPVDGGSSSTGTVTLASAAPAGGIVVSLSSGNGNATVPINVTIAQGQTSAQFTVNTSPVAAQQTVLITATSANSISASLTINATPASQGQISGLSLSPNPVDGGQSSTGTVTLAAAAPVGGILVNLSSGNANASTPASIVIPAGQTSGQFTVATSPVGAPETALITAASANSVNATLNINATPAGPGQLSSLSLSPTTVTGGESSTGTVTLAAAAPIGGVLVNLSSGNGVATIPASITIAAGQTSGQFTVATTAVASQQSALITATSANSVNATLTINSEAHCVSSLVLNASITDLLSGDGILTATATLDGPAPLGGSQISLLKAGVGIGVINIPEGQTSGSVDLTVTNLLAIVGSTVQAVLNGCPAVDATITLGSPITGAIAGLTLSPSTVFAGQSVTGTVSLVAPAGSNGVLVSLSTNNSSATILSSSVVVPAGQTSATFPINTVNTSADPVVVSITATSGPSSKFAALTINSSNPCVEGLQLTVNITNLATGSGVLNALVTLTGPAPQGGSNVPLLIGDTQIGQVAIPANQSTGTAAITLANLPTLVGSVVRAVFGPCGDINATISLSAPLLGNLTVPVSLNLGASATGTVILDSPAPAGGATVQLAKTPLGLVGDLLNALLGAVVIPSAVTIAEGQTQADFPITSSVIGGALGLLFPSSADLQIDATLDSAFSGNTLARVMQCNK